jgi:hypothetical protein
MLVEESYVDATKGQRYGYSGLYEPFTTDKGKLFRAYQREFGRCTGKVYVDRADRTIAVGWVFVGRTQYEDSRDTYLRETWITLHDEPPTVTRETHYHELEARP